jgi:ferredoxin
MEKELFAIPERCTGCGRCMYMCPAVKEGVFKPSKSRVYINHFSVRG